MNAPTTPLDDCRRLREQLTAELRAATAAPPSVDLGRRERLALWLRTQGEALRERAAQRRALLRLHGGSLADLAHRTVERLAEAPPASAPTVVHAALIEGVLLVAAGQVLGAGEGH